MVKFIRGFLFSVITDLNNLIVNASTGSGKTSQLAQYESEAFAAAPGLVVGTQSRILAAITIAKRISRENVILYNKNPYSSFKTRLFP
jgi:HrpA-like RNA helicase